MPKQTTAQVLAEMKEMKAEMKALRDEVVSLRAEKAAKEKAAEEAEAAEPIGTIWEKNGAKYNAARRAKRAARGLKKRGRKSPADAEAEPAAEESSSEEEAPAPKAKVAPTKAQAKALAITVPAEPPRLRDIFGDSVTCPTNVNDWIANNTMTWEELGVDAKINYPASARKALSNVGYTPPKTKDPIAISDYALSVPIDIWKVVTEATDSKYSVHQRNNFSKGLLGVFNEKIRKMTQDANTHKLCVWTKVLHLMNSNAARATGNTHEEQGQSKVAAANTSEWGEWKAKSSEFIAKAADDKSKSSQRDAMIIAVYSMIPPIRRNWFEMQVVTEAPPKDDKRNSILITDEEVVTYWGNFKNKKSFGKELPLRIPIENPALVAHIRKYAPTLKNQWFFPRSDNPQSKALSKATFGKRIGDLAEKIVGKRFTVNRMRASFITHWHRNNSQNGKMNIAASRLVMRQLHQANLATHLSYAKHHAEWDKAFAAIKGQADEPDA